MTRREHTPRRRRGSIGIRVGRSVALAIVALAVLAVPTTASAAVMTYMDIGDLVHDSDVIVRGEVDDRRTFRDEERGKVFTHTTIEVSETYLGEEQSSVTIEQFGGTYKETTHRIPGDAEFEIGEEVIVFLAENRGPKTSPHYLVGLAQSKFEVIDGDQGDGARVVRDLSGLELRADDGSSGDFGGLGRQTWTLPSFEAELEALVYAKENGALESEGSTHE